MTLSERENTMPHKDRETRVRYHRSYRRKWQLRYKYGLSMEQYEQLLNSQRNVCAICGQSETRTFRGIVSPLSVDHDHDTGKVRGLLCYGCNAGIGRLKDSPSFLTKAAHYLRSYGKIW